MAGRSLNVGIAFFFVFFIFTANEAFYFELTTDKLIVKNYLLPFVNIKYNISEITGIELAGTNYRATADAALKIYHDDKNSMGFRAASLDLKTWQAFVNNLNERKIPVTVSASRLIDKIGTEE
ncbi:hypothetical protein FO440_10845 [Mucilaginibacter corticis]|uniref:Uncharacterized protein n=1 Tax=Mucilaginibacter corticis TaxID=2597670 RepID=A0A556MK53_9SPHI|nr:hypothetical protein [Mucilaginibacter corticis]TSJ40253.1 hypothetical protein FO440_10845 [Mucilaginibacter corticis]